MAMRSFRVLAVSLLLSGCAPAAGTAAQPFPSAAEAPGRDAPAAQRPDRDAAAAPADSGVVRASGRAVVSVTPDQARVTLAVESREATASAAARANATAMNAVLDALRSALPGLDLSTHGYTLTPVYVTVREGGRSVSRIDGYRAANLIRATTSDLDGVGRIIDAAVEAGANRVAGISFESTRTDSARTEALRAATADALAQARAMASALGRELGPPLEVTGSAEAPPSAPPGLMRAMQAAESGTPVDAPQGRVVATVSATFSLGPARQRP